MSDKILLITGFEPFGGKSYNTSWEAVKELPDQIARYKIYKLQVPTVFGKAADFVIREARKLNADAVLCVGEAGGRTSVTPEMAAINLRYAGIPDNEGQQPMDEPVCPEGENAYFSTLPARAMAQEICRQGLPGSVSYSAGTYVCNDLFYQLLHHFKNTGTRCGFVHVPVIPEQADQDDAPLTLDCICRGLEAAVSVL